MRINIVIDDALMNDALHAAGLKDVREVVELGLRALLGSVWQEEIRKTRGTLHWRGDLDAMRTDS